MGSMDFLPLTGSVLDTLPLELVLRGGEEEEGGSGVVVGVASPGADSGIGETLSDNQLLSELFPSDFADQAIAESPVSSSSPPASAKPMLAAANQDPALLERNRRNAEAARLNRIKRKAYVEGLERERAVLKAENLVYKTKCTELKATVRQLQRETQYLRSVLANQSVLASLIENIAEVEGVKLSSSIMNSRKRPHTSSDDAQPSQSKKGKRDTPASSGGVCLHVSKDVVSLEFCAECSHQAVAPS